MATSKFSGSVPEAYHHYLVPLIFRGYAEDLAERVMARSVEDVLETAAGTGVLTECMVQQVPASTRIVSTDFSPAMLEVARGNLPPADNLSLQEANGIDLPFAEESFDVLVSQFGVMFFPDIAQGYREARRVLRPGGEFIFNVWDSLASNQMPRTVHEAALTLDADNPPDFLKTPWGYNDIDAISAQLKAAGFSEVTVTVLTKESSAPSARDVALAYAIGSPLAAQLEERGLSEQAVELFTETLEAKYGSGTVSDSMQAIVFQAR